MSLLIDRLHHRALILHYEQKEIIRLLCYPCARLHFGARLPEETEWYSGQPQDACQHCGIMQVELGVELLLHNYLLVESDKRFLYFLLENYIAYPITENYLMLREFSSLFS